MGTEGREGCCSVTVVPAKRKSLCVAGIRSSDLKSKYQKVLWWLCYKGVCVIFNVRASRGR